MKLHQRDIVETNFLLPNGEFKPHMAVIVSNEELMFNEGILYLALISSKDYDRQYCYELTENMIDFQLSKKTMSSAIFLLRIWKIPLSEKSAK
jgi:hypothetical protein